MKAIRFAIKKIEVKKKREYLIVLAKSYIMTQRASDEQKKGKGQKKRFL